MEMVIESDSEESVVFVDKGNDNTQAIDNNDLTVMLTDTESDSESDSYELLDMVIDTVPSSAASSSAASSSVAPSQPPIIRIPRYLDGTQPVDVLEVFGRTVSATASRRGLGSCPFDLKDGKDLSQLEMRIEVFRVIEQRRPKLLVTSPPCTMYSKLQRLWNIKKMSPEEYTRRKAIADEYLWFAHTCNKIQHNAGRSFAHEHPAGASSWKEDSTQAVVTLPGTYNALFDQCQFGLTSPCGTPLKKQTRILCNNVRLFNALHGCKCRRGLHTHKPIMGSEAGYRLSTWSEIYPPALCNALLDACCDDS